MERLSVPMVYVVMFLVDDLFIYSWLFVNFSWVCIQRCILFASLFVFGLYVYFRIFEYRSTVMVAPIAFSIWNISFDSYTEIKNKNKNKGGGLETYEQFLNFTMWLISNFMEKQNLLGTAHLLFYHDWWVIQKSFFIAYFSFINASAWMSSAQTSLYLKHFRSYKNIQKIRAKIK